MKKIFTYIILTITLCALVSCNDDSDSNPEEIILGNTLKKMKLTGVAWTDDMENHEYVFEYGENNKLIRYSDGQGAKVEFTYTDDLISQVDVYNYFNFISYPTAMIKYYYDSENRLIKFEHDFLYTGGDPDRIVEFTYIDDQHADYTYDYPYYGSWPQGQFQIHGTITFDNNNVLQVVSNIPVNPDYPNQFATNSKNYLYDTKKHVFSTILGYKKLMLYNAFFPSIYEGDGYAPNAGTTNNLIGEDDGSADYNYQYGNNDFPVEVTAISSGNRKIIYTY